MMGIRSVNFIHQALKEAVEDKRKFGEVYLTIGELEVKQCEEQI